MPWGLSARRETVAAEVLRLAIGNGAATAISLLICVSDLGPSTARFSPGRRIYYALGLDHRLYGWLGLEGRRGTPVRSLLVQGAITLVLIVWSA